MLTRHQGNPSSKSRLKSWRPAKSANHDALAGKRLAPDTHVVEAAHGGRDLGVQTPGELNDESFSSAGVQPQHHLQNTRAFVHE
jgi:hypothetical protein